MNDVDKIIDKRIDIEKEYLRKEFWQKVRAILTFDELYIVECFVLGEKPEGYSLKDRKKIKAVAFKKLKDELDKDWLEVFNE